MIGRALAVLALVACGDPDDPACADVPVVTWETFGDGFLTERCQGCHAEAVAEAAGVPSGVHFGTEDAARAHAERILARATGDAPTMPPQGGVDPDDRERLRIWLTCW